MSFHHSTCCEDVGFTLRNYLPCMGKEQMTKRVLKGLKCRQKHISSMFFYDAKGSRLFEEITRLPEYYPSRTEKKLLHQIAPVLFREWREDNIIEIGSGDCSKISILLKAIPPQRWPTMRYTPVDVSQEAIQGSAAHLQRQFAGIEVHGIVADFTRQLHLIPSGGRRLFCFLGSTLGNLSRQQAEGFLVDLGGIMLPGEALLLGVDMIKPVHVLERAYNDSRGITADFNRNILNVVNGLIGSDFDPQAFGHAAFYNERNNRIEMHLEATMEMQISCPAIPYKILIRKGETIHTENSHKYAGACIRDLAAKAGLRIRERFTDEKSWFSLMYLLKE
ncbi:MAG: L-histidine N(alpha)-methyltransferase [Thermodesulfobacteriota bacterium]|nr:L-histidine N(alpha)-methyltransferase [Thermodesulfobacteriota bacterium]